MLREPDACLPHRCARPYTLPRTGVRIVLVVALGLGTWFGWLWVRGGFRSAHAQYLSAVRLYESGAYKKAATEFGEAIALAPRFAAAYHGRASARLEMKDREKAIADYSSAIAIDSHFPYAYYGRGDALLRSEEYEKAIADLSEAIRLAPCLTQAYLARAGAYSKMGEYDSAIADLNEILHFEPRHAVAYSCRGTVWELKAKYGKAIADYNEAIALDGQMACAYYNRARLWAACHDLSLRNTKWAVESATRACELAQWERPDYLDTLAAATAASGNFESAANWQAKANALYSDEEDKLAGEMRLKIYRGKRDQGGKN